MMSAVATPRCPDGVVYRLLASDEPAPFEEINPQGTSIFLIAVDHASFRIPLRLCDLGLPSSELRRHIAWDIGALEIARKVSALLDATLIAQNYSRLVIDCNRNPEVASSIPLVSEYTSIPGNQQLSAQERVARRVELFEPYHRRIRECIDERSAASRPTILIAQHSMTDIYKGAKREMHAAILYNRDGRFAHRMLQQLRGNPALQIAENEPYFVSDETDYTIPRHAEARGLLHVEIEVRQDLVTHESGQTEWAHRIAQALQACAQITAATS